MPRDRDIRQAMVNAQAVGTAAQIQLPQERITRLAGIVIDLDPGVLCPGNPWFPPSVDPEEFLRLIDPAIARHPLASRAEVLYSGRGLHLKVLIDPAVEIGSAADQARWAHIARLVQTSLPSDPDAPGMTALTRAEGSINTKSGEQVRTLRPGRPVAAAEIEEFAAMVAAEPFRVVMRVLFGSDRVSPCPVCRGEGSRLDTLSLIGRCYGGCGKVKLGSMYDLVLLDRSGVIRPDGVATGN